MENVKRQHLELVGLLVGRSLKVETYHIDYIYKWELAGFLEGTALQRGFDFRLHIPFEDICLALCDAYASAMQQKWVEKNCRWSRMFLSLRYQLGPADVGITGNWTLESEW